MSDPNQAASFFARVSRELMEDSDEQPTMQNVVERSVTVVPACDFSSITLRRRRRKVETLAATNDIALRCDALQYELDEGPCVDAIWRDDAYLCRDTATDYRWPRWGKRVADLGAGSVLSVRLSSAAETIGALNMYSKRTDAFEPEDIDVALIFTMHATNAVSSARLVTGLQTAIESRHLIGVAQGVLMTRYNLPMPQAFEVLRRYSSHTNVKLRDVAQFVVDHHELPQDPELLYGEDGTVSLSAPHTGDPRSEDCAPG